MKLRGASYKITRIKVPDRHGTTFARRMLWLAWSAARFDGTSFLEDRGPQDEASIWRAVPHNWQPDGSGCIDVASLYGRQLGLRFTFGKDYVEGQDGTFTVRQQSFAYKYQSLTSLVAAAAADLVVNP